MDLRERMSALARLGQSERLRIVLAGEDRMVAIFRSRLPTTLCRACGGPTKQVRLGDEIVDRVVSTGGELTVIDAHAALERAEGIAALLRFPL
jgi:hypothetical protein